MADTKTTDEVTRSPVDGTEFVRLATAGANWKASLANIFTALGGAGAPVHSVQFNNPLGTFAGDADFTWVAGAGLTIGGVVGVASGETYNITSTNTSFITPVYAGTGGNLFQGHTAVGNYADVDNPTVSPGDPVNAVLAPGRDILVVNDFSTGDLSVGSGINSGIILYPGYRHTGVSPVAFVAGIDNEASINSDSTGPVNHAVGGYQAIFNYGSGPLSQVFGLEAYNFNFGSANYGNFEGLLFGAIHSGSGTIATLLAAADCFWVNDGGGHIATAYTIFAETPGQGGGSTTDNCYGLYVGDHSGIGGTVSENIHSAGASSINYFEGFTNTGGTVVASLPTPTAYLKGMRYYVTNALAPAFGAVVAGAGAVTVPVFCNGTDWIVG